MTAKQCRSCKFRHVWIDNGKEDVCHFQCPQFMKNKNCPQYKYGSFEEYRQEIREKLGRELP